MRKKYIYLALTASIFITGLSVMLYPLVSDYINSLKQARVLARYYEDVVKLSKNDFSAYLEAARKYNAALLKNKNRFKLTEEDFNEYRATLDFTGRGIIGTLEIEKINVKLPVYLGTDEAVLQIGAGHMEGTSLPVGGPNTHSVITAHRGLPTSTLLTHLNKLEENDLFVLNILNEKLMYCVDSIHVVNPDDFSLLTIEPEKDYCTLMTCTPYGINSHRLLARGFRVI